ncbi:hypothetical protein [Streptomyces rubradiris]|uniref:MYXO-CTERM domain-containing protein n=1 Tax=Streptomyces rubradiris TaxID=285531 RepID=A0ABQ3RG04_STRRR|nr:hypothetical protein [Streptomyces rubradiris]GHG95908.1 hypothetical protein GCM10018792_06430 [Streptomyces rubradiris]GHI54737.1 hypothetical protein Srubr_45830 [Streptomyces rubradiris]
MAHAVFALAAGTLTAAGSVWYLPALADLRAGADRPASHRQGAAACLTGWGTIGVAAVLLLVADAWWIPGTAVVAGAVPTAGLRVRAAMRRRRETEEAAHHWARLCPARPLDRTSRPHKAVAALIGSGVAAATAIAVLLAALAGPAHGSGPRSTDVWPPAVVALFLVAALVRTLTRRRRHSDAAGRRALGSPGAGRQAG